MGMCIWPELGSYCCCGLAKGIYIGSFISIVVLFWRIVFIGFLVLNLFGLLDYLYNDEDTRDVHKTILMVVTQLWILFHLLYATVIILTIYSVVKKKTRMLKVLYTFNVVCLTLDFLVTFTGSFLSLRIFGIMFIWFLPEGYRLLAAYSIYKKYIGKSAILNDVEIISNINHEFLQTSLFTGENENTREGVDCIPMEPTLSIQQAIRNDVASNRANENNLDTSESGVKKLNFEENTVIFDESQLQCENDAKENMYHNTAVVESLSPLEEAKKINLVEEVVIFDETQLQYENDPEECRYNTAVVESPSLSNEDCDLKKLNFIEETVIFDESQLKHELTQNRTAL